MIKALVSDFSKVLLFPKEPNCQGKLNDLYCTKLGEKNFNFTNYVTFNEELLSYFQLLKDKVELYIFTSGIMQEDREIQARIRAIFTKIYSAEKFRLDKQEPSAYLFITKDINRRPSEIVFIDDKEANVNAAKSAGLNGIQFASNTQLFNELKRLVVTPTP